MRHRPIASRAAAAFDNRFGTTRLIYADLGPERVGEIVREIEVPVRTVVAKR